MTHETASPPSAPGASPEKRALLEAFDTVLKSQAEVREAERLAAEAARRARRRVRPLIWFTAAMTLCLTAYLWVERPTWIFPAAIPPESLAIKEASLRIGLANAAQHVERFRQRTGRLPESLSETGAHGEWLSYERTGSSDWRLVGSNGPVQLTLTSSQPLPDFLGNSFEVISRRQR